MPYELDVTSCNRNQQGCGKIRIAVSACLLGENVRYDGGHSLDLYISDTLGEYFDFVAICPEKGCGLTVPREPMRLEGNPATPRLVVISSGEELTGRMLEYCRREIEDLRQEGICGFILKARSPSCGVFDTPVQVDDSTILAGAGIFAQAVMKGFPGLPVEDEETIKDPATLERFLEMARNPRPPGP